jgi:hypothetical protein
VHDGGGDAEGVGRERLFPDAVVELDGALGPRHDHGRDGGLVEARLPPGDDAEAHGAHPSLHPGAVAQGVHDGGHVGFDTVGHVDEAKRAAAALLRQLGCDLCRGGPGVRVDCKSCPKPFNSCHGPSPALWRDP